MESAAPAPVSPLERIPTIDIVRGLAVLGILVMNIVEFAWPEQAYENPAYAGGAQGLDLASWYLQVTLFDGKMRALFSMLFGAGLVLIAERMASKGQGERTADLLLRRCLWLVPLGILHRFGLQWTGDILYQYGLLGALAVAFRNLRPRTLIILGLCALTAFVPIGMLRHSRQVKIRDQAAQAAVLQERGDEVADELAAAKRRWDALQKSVPGDPKEIEKVAAPLRGGYLDVFAARWDYHHSFQSAYLYYYFVWDVLGMVFLGMGLMKVGFFAGSCRTGLYLGCVVVGSLTAGALGYWAWRWHSTGFSPTAIDLRLWKDTTYGYSRGIVALAWASLLILLVRVGRLRWLTGALGAVGRMAFTNYILQTVCCTLLFLGYGLGYFATWSRSTLMLVVVGVSLVQVLFSLVWQRWFLFGPLEWVWRCLTYWRWQPLLRRSPTPGSPAG